MNLVDFIITIYHDVRSPERQIIYNDVYLFMLNPFPLQHLTLYTIMIITSGFSNKIFKVFSLYSYYICI